MTRWTVMKSETTKKTTRWTLMSVNDRMVKLEEEGRGIRGTKRKDMGKKTSMRRQREEQLAAVRKIVKP